NHVRQKRFAPTILLPIAAIRACSKIPPTESDRALTGGGAAKREAGESPPGYDHPRRQAESREDGADRSAGSSQRHHRAVWTDRGEAFGACSEAGVRRPQGQSRAPPCCGWMA